MIYFMLRSLWFSLLFCCLFIAGPSYGQYNYSPAFAKKLLEMNAEIMPPLDGGYRKIRTSGSWIQDCDWAIRSKREKLEIRYLVTPLETGGPGMQHPDLAAHRLAMHLCSNDDDAMISGRDLTEHEVKNIYNADWGRIYIFPPKLGFAPHAYCKMVALQREEEGLVYIFNLFDTPSPAIDSRMYTFSFEKESW